MSRRTAVSALFVAAAAGIGLYLSRGPWVAYREQKAKAENAQHEMQKAEIERSDLLRQRAMADSPLGQEAAARSKGYLKKGEGPLKPGT